MDVDVYGTNDDLLRPESELVTGLLQGRVRGSTEEFVKRLEQKGEVIDWASDSMPESQIHELLPRSLRSVLSVPRDFQVQHESGVGDIECSVLVEALAVWRPSFAVGREELVALMNFNSDLTITMQVYSSENE